jgi:hypothetical protein
MGDELGNETGGEMPTAETPVQPDGAAHTVPVDNAPNDHTRERRVTLGRGVSVLLGVLLLLVGIGTGVAIGAGIWAGNSAPNVVHVAGFGGNGRFGGPGRRPLPGGAPGFGRFGSPSTAAPVPGGFGNFGFGATAGKVTAVSGNSVTVREGNGMSVTVTVPPSASVTTTRAGSVSNITTGSCIRVGGGAPAGGSPHAVTAKTVQVLPAGSTGCP